MDKGIKLNFDYYPLVVGQLDKYTFSDWEIEGGNIKLNAYILSDDYENSDITWTSSNDTIAVVDGEGNVHALTTGLTEIKASLPDGESAKCVIQVIDNPGRLTARYVKLNTDRLVLNKTEGAALYPNIFPVDYFKDGRLDNTFTWKSSDEDIVTVNSKGRIFAKNKGKAVITAVSNDVGRTVSCEITVIKKSKEELTKDPLEDMHGGVINALTGDKVLLKLPDSVSDQPVNWCSENESIATVDDKGNVSVHTFGYVNIWATFINGGFRVKYEFRIKKADEHYVEKVVFSTNELHLAVGERKTIHAAVFPATHLDKQLLWRCVDEGILKIVDQKINLSGLDEITVEAVSQGKTILTGAFEGRADSCNVIVEKISKTVEMLFLPEKKVIEPQEIIKLKPAINKDATNDELIWISDKKSVCTVDRNGIIKGYEKGAATVYCIAKGSISVLAEYELSVIKEHDNIRDDASISQKLKNILLNTVYDVCDIEVKADSDYIYNLHIPKETVTDESIKLLWNRESMSECSDLKEYRIYDNGRFLCATTKIGYTVKNLKPLTDHTFEVKAISVNDEELGSRFVAARTSDMPECVIDVTHAPYNAVGNGIIIDTAAIQKAINDCPKNGVVYLPEGYVFHSGALFLKSDMTLKIDGILFGSENPEDYPEIVCRWEGYRKLKLTKQNQMAVYPVFENNVYSHSSLINIGVYDEGESGKLSPYNTRNVKICGKGMINGNGFSLAHNEGPCWYIYRKGLPIPQSPKTDQNVRGRVIALYNTKYAYISDVTVAYGPSWTIHPVFSDCVTFDNVKVISMGNGRTGVMEGMLILNGDGIDPDSSTNINITDCYFTVGDDAVAIKSGRNREGNELDKPSAYIRVTDCKTVDAKGAFCIGSEQAGGAHDILFQNIIVDNILHLRLWIKSAPCRGGIVEDVIFKDCILKNTGGALQIEYNHGGDENPALELPITRRVKFENIDFTGKHKFGIRIMGVENSPIYSVSFKDCHFADDFIAKKDGKFVLKDCHHIDVSDIELPQGYAWE